MTDEKALIVEKTEEIKSKVVINKKIKDGIFKQKQTRLELADGVNFDDLSVEDQIKFMKAQMDFICESTRDRRQSIHDDLDEFERIAQQVARNHGCPTDSTLDGVTTETVDENGILRVKQQLAGEAAEPLTAFKFAYKLEYRVKVIRGSIRDFEATTSDKEALNAFYMSMSAMLGLVEDYSFLREKGLEVDILRGREKNFNHGATEEVQRQGAKEHDELVKAGYTSNQAVEEVRTKYGKSRSAIREWVKKFSTS